MLAEHDHYNKTRFLQLGFSTSTSEKTRTLLPWKTTSHFNKCIVGPYDGIEPAKKSKNLKRCPDSFEYNQTCLSWFCFLPHGVNHLLPLLVGETKHYKIMNLE